MIQLPRRHVTRFFIPLIDVLILLFCIFLLMPYVKDKENQERGALTPGRAGDLKRQLDLVQAELESLRKAKGTADKVQELENELKELRKKLEANPADLLWRRQFQIDPQSGALTYTDPERLIVRSQADALTLIERDRAAAARAGKRLYYIINYPYFAPRQQPTEHPTFEAKRRYTRWLSGVDLDWAMPGAGPAAEKTEKTP